MAERDLARLGGVCGLLFALLMVPAYVVGYPDAPTSTSSAEDVIAYFGEGPGAFVLANGVLPLFSAFFFVWFLGVLHGVLRRSEGEGGVLSSVALAGGTLFIVLSCAGYAAEILYPASLARFEGFAADARFAFASLVLSAWLYHFCQVGTAVMATATSLVALQSGVLPRWLALAGFLVALLALLHFLTPLLGALAGLVWVVLVSALMLAGAVGTFAPRRLARRPA
ncbi:MAG TPA: hypothetical protein VK869_09585 [Rubrobacteraceae bacterium]|nr:hypothetical protein [Rubrobacteraceae bacterium]